MRSRRLGLAAAVITLWIVGLAMMVRRNASRSEQQLLAETALRLQPATFYYVVERDGQRIGAASSAVDTTLQNLVSEEYFVGDYPVKGAVQRTSARWQTRLSRAFRLQNFSIDIARATNPFSIRGSVQEDTTIVVALPKTGTDAPAATANFTAPLFTPALASVAFMLAGRHEIGHKQAMSVFDPTTRRVIRPELAIRAESLFIVVDSAALNQSGEWSVAHRDTVRAWRVEGAPAGLTAWVDAEGRVVAARLANGLSVTRTAFEIAFRNPQSR